MAICVKSLKNKENWKDIELIGIKYTRELIFIEELTFSQTIVKLFPRPINRICSAISILSPPGVISLQSACRRTSA